ncbi:MAG: D-alanine--D-alanine ligase [Firmicutes bacterium]|nr:D-alanine--D-alanine ligase [Bacillota bacterium]
MKVVVFFGGKSCEHNVSIITGMQTIKALKTRFDVIAVYIDQQGTFWTGKDLEKIESYKKGAKPKKIKVFLSPASNILYNEKGKAISQIDSAILATHGYGGEDGCLQGLLSLCNIPFSGSGVLASAVGMDKVFMKKIFAQSGLPLVPYIAVSKDEYKNERVLVIEKIRKQLIFPLIVKPASGGSSIGISVAKDLTALFEAIKVGFLWDNTIIIENCLSDFVEYNCAVLGDKFNAVTSEIERPIATNNFLSYQDKYARKQKGTGREFPAAVSMELRKKIKTLAKQAFCSINGGGVARIDFLYDGVNLFVNEINTIPGSLSFYLFKEGDVTLSFTDLLERLIHFAKERKAAQDALQYRYESNYELQGMGGKSK